MEVVTLPKLGQTMESGTIDNWLIEVGDTVSKGDVIVEITTDKASAEVECFVEGTLRKILAPEGEEIDVGGVIAWIGSADEDLPETLGVSTQKAAVVAEPSEAKSKEAPAPVQAGVGKVKATPRARKLAKELGVIIETVAGSGPGGRITEDDVKNHGGGSSANERAELPGAPTVNKLPLTTMRKTIAGRISKSAQEAPHFYLTMDFDMTEAVLYRTRYKETSGEKISYHDLIVRACAMAFAEQPEANRVWLDDAIGQRTMVDVGLAVSLEGGLMVPVVRGADKKSLKNISVETADLIVRTREQKLKPNESGEASITISNLGMYGVSSFLPILNLGESLILGLGTLAETAVVIHGGIQVRTMMTVTLSCDHRVIDGAVGAAFLQKVKSTLENPNSL